MDSNGFFEPGDIVYLKSGSPRATIISMSNTTITVAWVNYETGTLTTLEGHPSAFRLDRGGFRESVQMQPTTRMYPDEVPF